MLISRFPMNGCFGRFLCNDDLDILLSNLQAYAARDFNIDMLIGASMSVQDLIHAVTMPDGENLIYDKAIRGSSHVAIVFQEAGHFRSLLFDPREKCIYIFDSLNIQSDNLETAKGMS